MTEPEEIDLNLDHESDLDTDQQYIESDDDFICFDKEQIDTNQNLPE